jgi:hypothetical protein
MYPARVARDTAKRRAGTRFAVDKAAEGRARRDARKAHDGERSIRARRDTGGDRMENRRNEMGEGQTSSRMGEGVRGGNPLDELGPEVSRQIEELRGRLDETMDRVGDFIRERPATSLLIAAGVGYIVGRIVRS